MSFSPRPAASAVWRTSWVRTELALWSCPSPRRKRRDASASAGLKAPTSGGGAHHLVVAVPVEARRRGLPLQVDDLRGVERGLAGEGLCEAEALAGLSVGRGAGQVVALVVAGEGPQRRQARLAEGNHLQHGAGQPEDQRSDPRNDAGNGGGGGRGRRHNGPQRRGGASEAR
jgi:hypothetical protein